MTQVVTQPETRAPTVYLVDDDNDVRTALTRSLSKRGFHVLSFASADAFLQEVEPGVDGCLILDYGMPKMDGLELQAHLNATGCDLPVIFITGHGGIPESVRATKAGALDFLEKPFSLPILLERIETALEISTQRSKAKVKEAEIANRLATLTKREHEVFAFILANPSLTSSKEIAQNLGISPRTVDIHRGRVLKKLVVKTMVELIDVYAV